MKQCNFYCVLLGIVCFSYLRGADDRYQITRALIKREEARENALLASTGGAIEHRPFMCVSLGWNCFTAQRLSESNIRFYSFPLDWNQTPIRSLHAILQKRFEDILAPQYLKISPRGWCGILNTRYTFSLSHDFPTGKDGEPVSNFVDFLPEISEKYQRRIERLFDVCDLADFVYFFRVGSRGWPNDIYQSRQEVATLRDILLKLFPKKNWLLVALCNHADYANDWGMPMVKSYRFHNDAGAKKEWISVFKDLGLI